MHTTMIWCQIKLNSKYTIILVTRYWQWRIITTGGDHTVSMARFITNKRIQISITLIPLVLFLVCGTLLTTFAIISNGMYWAGTN